MRYENMRELMRNMSPDVRIEGQEQEPGKPLPVAETPARQDHLASRRKILEERFLSAWEAACSGTIELEREYRFHTARRWRFDFADPKKRIAYEIQGGMYVAKSGHRSREGVMRDQEKLNAAVMDGWKVFQVNSEMLRDTEYIRRLADFHLHADYV